MKTFILHWNDGKTEKVKGDTIANAMMNAGYGGGAASALDYYETENAPNCGNLDCQGCERCGEIQDRLELEAYCDSLPIE